MIPSHRLGWYIRTSHEGCRSHPHGARTGGSHLEERQEDEEESAEGWRAGDARKAGREGEGLRRPRAPLQWWRLQKARVQSRAQVAQGRVACGGHEQGYTRG